MQRERFCETALVSWSLRANLSWLPVLPSTLDSPLSVAIMYNIFWSLSRVFVKFYVFDKAPSPPPAKRTKGSGPGLFLWRVSPENAGREVLGAGLVLVLSAVSW